MSVRYIVESGVAVLTLDHPPVNSLGLSLRQEVMSALEQALADDSIRAIVVTGGDKIFSAGADIREFGTAKALMGPSLRSLVTALEESPKPVVAAISGLALGGGFELALACHYRLTSANAKFGLPEVKLGLLPGAGGTQRITRLAGVAHALNLCVSGEIVPVSALAGTAVIDQVIETDLLGAAILFARDQGKSHGPWPRARDREVVEPNLEAFAQFARNMVRAARPNEPAALACVEAVTAAVGDFEKGLQLEGSQFAQLIAGPVSRSLRHRFLAERAATRVDDMPEDTPRRLIATAAVVGGGTMGSGIAQCFLNVGIPVKLLEMGPEALDRAVARIREAYDGQVKKRKLSAVARDQRLALLTAELQYESIGSADIVIEAVFETMESKQAVFTHLDRVMKPGAILATNTSTLDVNRIAQFTSRPNDVIGTHFFSPAPVMRLLEIVRGSATDLDVLATTLDLAKTLKKQAVVSGVCDGFIGNRMFDPYFRQAELLLLEGASPQQVDSAVERFGLAMGPFRMSDLAGNDISWHIRRRRYAEKPGSLLWPIADRVCGAGRFGQKTQAGWYDYRPGDRSALPSAVVQEMIDETRRSRGITPRKIQESELVDRLIFALVNEGALVLEEKIAARASDIDVVYTAGYGFPAWRGGPMFYADEIGLYEVVRTMQQLARNPHADPGSWTPAPLLMRLARDGGTFNGASS